MAVAPSSESTSPGATPPSRLVAGTSVGLGTTGFLVKVELRRLWRFLAAFNDSVWFDFLVTGDTGGLAGVGPSPSSHPQLVSPQGEPRRGD